MDEQIEARCLCGGICLSYSGPVGPANYCHCDDCRRANGSAFNIGVRLERAHLNVDVRTELKSYGYVSDSGGRIERCFCAQCGSPLFTLHPDRPEYVWVKAGIISNPNIVRPEFEIWTKDKVPWAVINVAKSYEEGRTSR